MEQYTYIPGIIPLGLFVLFHNVPGEPLNQEFRFERKSIRLDKCIFFILFLSSEVDSEQT